VDVCGYVDMWICVATWRVGNSSWLLLLLLLLHASPAATTVWHCFALNAIYVAVSTAPPWPPPHLKWPPSTTPLSIVRGRVFGRRCECEHMCRTKGTGWPPTPLGHQPLHSHRPCPRPCPCPWDVHVLGINNVLSRY